MSTVALMAKTIDEKSFQVYAIFFCLTSVSCYAIDGKCFNPFIHVCNFLISHFAFSGFQT